MPHPDPDHVRLELRRFLATLTADAAAIDDGDDIVARGLIKSMHVMDIVNHLEEQFGVAVTHGDVFAGRLRSVHGMVGLVLAGKGL